MLEFENEFTHKLVDKERLITVEARSGSPDGAYKYSIAGVGFSALFSIELVSSHDTEARVVLYNGGFTDDDVQMIKGLIVEAARLIMARVNRLQSDSVTVKFI